MDYDVQQKLLRTKHRSHSMSMNDGINYGKVPHTA